MKPSSSGTSTATSNSPPSEGNSTSSGKKEANVLFMADVSKMDAPKLDTPKVDASNGNKKTPAAASIQIPEMVEMEEMIRSMNM